MEIVEIIKTVDGGIAIAVMLFIGWMIDRRISQQWNDLFDLINRLIDKKDESHPDG